MSTLDPANPELSRGAPVSLTYGDIDWKTLTYERGVLSASLTGYNGDIQLLYDGGEIRLASAIAGNFSVDLWASPMVRARLRGAYARGEAAEPRYQAVRCGGCRDIVPEADDGWDGLCGNCADRAEREPAWRGAY